MNDQDQIQDRFEEAILIAWKALPPPNGDVDRTRDFETTRVCLSADVTARCRELGLLTSRQYISFDRCSLYPENDAEGHPAHRVRPVVYAEGESTHLFRGHTMPECAYERVQPCKILQDEFLAIKPLLHPFHRQTPFKIQTGMLIGTGIDPNKKAVSVAPPPRPNFYSIGSTRPR